jgi:hypothetical protein
MIRAVYFAAALLQVIQAPPVKPPNKANQINIAAATSSPSSVSSSNAAVSPDTRNNNAATTPTVVSSSNLVPPTTTTIGSASNLVTPATVKINNTNQASHGMNNSANLSITESVNDPDAVKTNNRNVVQSQQETSSFITSSTATPSSAILPNMDPPVDLTGNQQFN